MAFSDKPASRKSTTNDGKDSQEGYQILFPSTKYVEGPSPVKVPLKIGAKKAALGGFIIGVILCLISWGTTGVFWFGLLCVIIPTIVGTIAGWVGHLLSRIITNERKDDSYFFDG